MRKVLSFVLMFSIAISFETLSESKLIDNMIPYTMDHSRMKDFSINKNLPNERFFRVSYNYKYLIDGKYDFAILSSSKESFKIVFNDKEYFGEEYGRIELPISYFYKNNDQLYLLITQLTDEYDDRGAIVYKIINGELLKTDGAGMQVDIVGIDSLLTYCSYWFMGYQTVESLIKINSEGKFENIGISRFVDVDRLSPSKFYTVKKDITYNRIVDNQVALEESVLKPGTKMQLLETDLKSYIEFRTSNGYHGRINVKRVDSRTEIEFKDINGDGLEKYFLLPGQYASDIFDTTRLYWN